MPVLTELLAEFADSLTDQLHQRLLAAYIENPTPENLIDTCNSYVLEEADEAAVY